ncbi:uncharacterized protein L3040_003543 [Drepanopeziza brunnea f. sp. 'multigermtubi']|uniref:Uncharacterized protein n=1 Tax=Marssonina brunnea f. sp. multigermtubi (strain MB_m1) TaxID=1072389 RepID=K1WYM1_MARBU|nr:uncharacterized protein MBM_04031 [Drepanopeziza brunnea f. sp. 'multigermtubi' MB_m1]EKD17662.1 hypothetical protein MBM_04031 [Drepanopeziza brunnea f. sp. 'multigermtubi' MB_m1]KAJ5046296.1 hypothetical protein L3040_003543 [Drepanopeziza brunnea f. sp. 'multigermtubi']
MRLSILPLLAVVAGGDAKTPSRWSGYMNPQTPINTSRMVDSSPSLLVGSYLNNTPHLTDIIGTCKNQQGGIVVRSDCQRSVLSIGMAMGLSVLSWKTTDWWAGAFGPNGSNRKRALDAADDFFSHLPDSLAISNIKIQGTALPASSTARSLHRRKSGAEEFCVFYNGSLPLTFMVHHQVKTPTSAATDAVADAAAATVADQHFIPLFVATDGSKMLLTHVAPISQLAPAPGAGTLKARSGFDEYNHVGAGGIKLLANSDPVASWADVMNWLNSRTENGGTTPYQSVYSIAAFGNYLGHSLVNTVHDGKSAWGYNAQFAMEGFDHGFAPDWEDDFNWCFGAYPTNCES